MARWHAVVAGVLVALAMEVVIVLVSGRLSLIGGLVGSGVAGYVASSDPTDGAWHGLLTALSWGLVLIPVGVLVTLTRGVGLPFPLEFVLPLLRTPGDVTTAMVLLVTLPNLVTGTAGSVVRGGTGPPTWLPEDWA
jgi:hypothetical protein